MNIVHVTAHLGGGVGNALAVLCEGTARYSPGVHRHIVCLERPQKRQFLERIELSGATVTIAPQVEDLRRLVREADVVQLEWWNHPATIEALYRLSSVPIRLVVWSHISGLFNPIVPPLLIDAADAFVASAHVCPDRCPRSDLPRAIRPIRFVSSAGGFEHFAPPPFRDLKGAPPRFGYVGTTNYTKLFPGFVEFLSSVAQPDFSVRVIGDEVNRVSLVADCATHGFPTLLDFTGYKENILAELATLDVLVHLLNPRHYGTAEIALLEAMAMGVVPIVLDNPIERQIVSDGEDGFVVGSKEQFVTAVDALRSSASLRKSMSRRAAQMVRAKYTSQRMVAQFDDIYSEVLVGAKREQQFDHIFGATPSAWFLSCQRDGAFYQSVDSARLKSDLYLRLELTEVNKGSLSHFSTYFADDAVLDEMLKDIRRHL